MNRIVVSIPRVLDSAVIVERDEQLQIPTGSVPSTAVAPFTVTKIKAVPAETLMKDMTVTPLSERTRCSRVTATVTIPVTMSITDANGLQFETHTGYDKPIDIVLYVPDDATFPYTITCEGALGCCGTKCAKEETTVRQAVTKILTRVTAVTDLLIPTYGYAPINQAERFNQCDGQNFINQPLFPVGKVY